MSKISSHLHETILLENILRIKLEKPMILEVGCGHGELSNALALRGHQVLGIDCSAEHLKVACAKDQTKSVIYQVAMAHELPHPDHTFDVVTILTGLKSIDPKVMLRELERVLKPGGLILYDTRWSELEKSSLIKVETFSQTKLKVARKIA